MDKNKYSIDMEEIKQIKEMPNHIRDWFMEITGDDILDLEDISHLIIEEWEYLKKKLPKKELKKGSVNEYIRKYKYSVGNINLIIETEYNENNRDGLIEYHEGFLGLYVL
jgi:hypothetical protein